MVVHSFAILAGSGDDDDDDDDGDGDVQHSEPWRKENAKRRTLPRITIVYSSNFFIFMKTNFFLSPILRYTLWCVCARMLFLYHYLILCMRQSTRTPRAK